MSGKSPQARPRGLTHGGSSANIPPPRGGQRTRAESSPQDRPPQVDLLGNRYPPAAVKPPPRDRSASMNQRKPDSSDLHGMPTPNRKPEDKNGDSVNHRQRSESQRKTPAPTFRPNSQARNDDQQFAQTISSGTAVTPSRNLPPRRGSPSSAVKSSAVKSSAVKQSAGDEDNLNNTLSGMPAPSSRPRGTSMAGGPPPRQRPGQSPSPEKSSNSTVAAPAKVAVPIRQLSPKRAAESPARAGPVVNGQQRPAHPTVVPNIGGRRGSSTVGTKSPGPGSRSGSISVPTKQNSTVNHSQAPTAGGGDGPASPLKSIPSITPPAKARGKTPPGGSGSIATPVRTASANNRQLSEGAVAARQQSQPLTEEQKTKQTHALVTESWAAVCARYTMHQVGQFFYDALFIKAPGLKGTLFENTNMTMQPVILIKTIDAAVKLLDQPDTLEMTLVQLGERHAGYGAEAPHYAVVGEVFLGVLESGLGDAFTADVKAAWTVVYGVIQDCMLRGQNSEKGQEFANAYKERQAQHNAPPPVFREDTQQHIATVDDEEFGHQEQSVVTQESSMATGTEVQKKQSSVSEDPLAQAQAQIAKLNAQQQRREETEGQHYTQQQQQQQQQTPTRTPPSASIVQSTPPQARAAPPSVTAPHSNAPGVVIDGGVRESSQEAPDSITYVNVILKPTATSASHSSGGTLRAGSQQAPQMFRLMLRGETADVSVESLKEALYDFTNIPIDRQRLVKDGLLLANRSTGSDFGLSPGTILYLDVLPSAIHSPNRNDPGAPAPISTNERTYSSSSHGGGEMTPLEQRSLIIEQQAPPTTSAGSGNPGSPGITSASGSSYFVPASASVPIPATAAPPRPGSSTDNAPSPVKESATTMDRPTFVATGVDARTPSQPSSAVGGKSSKAPGSVPPHGSAIVVSEYQQPPKPATPASGSDAGSSAAPMQVWHLTSGAATAGSSRGSSTAAGAGPTAPVSGAASTTGSALARGLGANAKKSQPPSRTGTAAASASPVPTAPPQAADQAPVSTNGTSDTTNKPTANSHDVYLSNGTLLTTVHQFEDQLTNDQQLEELKALELSIAKQREALAQRRRVYTRLQDAKEERLAQQEQTKKDELKNLRAERARLVHESAHRHASLSGNSSGVEDTFDDEVARPGARRYLREELRQNHRQREQLEDEMTDGGFEEDPYRRALGPQTAYTGGGRGSHHNRQQSRGQMSGGGGGSQPPWAVESDGDEGLQMVDLSQDPMMYVGAQGSAVKAPRRGGSTSNRSGGSAALISPSGEGTHVVRGSRQPGSNHHLSTSGSHASWSGRQVNTPPRGGSVGTGSGQSGGRHVPYAMHGPLHSPFRQTE